MILPPVTPVMPIDPTRVYELVSANTEAVKAVLFLLGFIAFAIVSSVLTVRYLAKAKTGLYSEIGGSIAMAVAVLLFIRYGASLVALQGLLLYDLLLYASVSDIRTRKAEDWAWIAMIPLALCSIPRMAFSLCFSEPVSSSFRSLPWQFCPRTKHSEGLTSSSQPLRLFYSARFAVWADTLSDFLPRSFLR